MEQQQRLYYVDFLRVSAFFILIAYHAAIPFFPHIHWLIEAPQGSRTLEIIMDFPRAWRLALLFFLSGMGTWFLFRREHGLEFLRLRFMRLFVPLIFAMCVIVVPQVWYERMYEDGYQGSFLVFWVTRYFTEGKYPQGNFTWAHMWFVAYLLVMTFICYPIFRLVISGRIQPWMSRFERLAGSGFIYAFFLLPLVLNVVFSPFFPRETNALYNDGAWFAVWASWFGLGFLFASRHDILIGGIIKRRWISATLMGALALFLYLFSWTSAGGMIIGDYEHQTLLFKTALFALAWCTIMTLIGFTAGFFRRPSSVLAWLNRKVFPFYIVHQTITVGALYYILPLQFGVWWSFTDVILITFVGSFAFAVLADQLPARFALLVGLPPRQRQGQPARAVAAP